MTTSPSSITPRCWEPLNKIELDPGNYSYMTCHWTDVERGIVVPKYRGQIFYFVDLDSMWVYYPEAIEPKRDEMRWFGRLLLAIFILTLLGVGWLLWQLISELYQRTGWFW